MPKKLQFLLLLLFAVLALPERSLAAPGDTTRVTIWNQRKLSRNGLYDTTAILPGAGTRYRKVLLHYILGRYACTPGSQYCGSWDYTTRVLVRPPAHDPLEIARIMTPYATDWLALNKKHDYVVDVTDYTPVLNGNQPFQFDYQGYSWGFTLTLVLEYIEGTPPQDPIDVRNVYDGTYNYGDAADPIDNHMPARTFTAPSTGTTTLKNLVSGHGFDDANCAEFCNKYYRVLVNGTLRSTTQLWRNDCGRNQVYPQTGTWVYDRGNWCPGAVVKPLRHALTPLLTPGSPFTVDINMQAYTGTVTRQGAARANYIWTSQLVTAGPINFRNDAAMEEIISPNNNENYFRDNPSCGGPKVRIRNLGSTTLTAANISYRVQGRGAVQTYAWTGSLAYGRDTLVVLPILSAVQNGAAGRFKAWIAQPNGARDSNAYNDTLSVKFNATAVLPASFVVAMRTNNAVTNTLASETSWQVFDVAGNVVKQRVNSNANTTYNDTLRLQPGCYALRVTDLGCDGFDWWASPQAGTGTMRLNDARTGATFRNFSGDFGCEYTLNFRVAGNPSATGNPALLTVFDVYPNPSQDGRFTLDLNLPARHDVRLNVRDALGRRVWTRDMGTVKTTVQPLELGKLAEGVYDLEVAIADGTTLHRRIVIE
ncbi:peptide-N-glycosidase F-related protein [Hymenobacter sp. ASUV-10]|uniref:Peptide-N-glycosidase F-related protein n=1 Tax=Hymenobacter aranciens TaxID=3063996 RepID=A0ABT9B7E3_9BACT|nr:peptide-N-glycosidase F-related protein [Hymenobacter sp. ASUV-10]MDO7874130.1 peptide-N-glycosidase F-related protein [Hymenobacter sp. ASUV-10]